jgi:hypothetical protein
VAACRKRWAATRLVSWTARSLVTYKHIKSRRLNQKALARVQTRPSSSGATSAHLMVCGWVYPTPQRPMNAVEAEPTPYFFEVPGLTGTPVDLTQIRGAEHRARRSEGLLGRVPLRHAKHQARQVRLGIRTPSRRMPEEQGTQT